MYKFIFFVFSGLLTVSFQLCSTDIKEGGHSEKSLISQINLDKDLQEKLEALSTIPIDELIYYEVANILNEQQIRYSAAGGFIVPVTHEKIVYINMYDDQLLEKFYGADKQKLSEAKSYWNSHRRTGVIGLPPQWPVTLKECISYGGAIIIAGAAYCIYNSVLAISIEK